MNKTIKSGVNYVSGLAAEDAVQRCYASKGAAILNQRWRGQAGEIDLVLRDGDYLVFVEVKKARTHAQAAQRLQSRQAARIAQAAQEYLAVNGHSMLCDMRFDLALVDAAGRVEQINNVQMVN